MGTVAGVVGYALAEFGSRRSEMRNSSRASGAVSSRATPGSMSVCPPPASRPEHSPNELARQRRNRDSARYRARVRARTKRRGATTSSLNSLGRVRRRKGCIVGRDPPASTSASQRVGVRRGAGRTRRTRSARCRGGVRHKPKGATRRSRFVHRGVFIDWRRHPFASTFTAAIHRLGGSRRCAA